MQSISRCVRAVGCLCMAFTVAGCAVYSDWSKNPLFDVTRVGTQQEAGSTHVAVLSVARWETYQPLVQPNFSLTSDQALAAALPDTTAVETKALSSVAGQLSVQASTAASAPPTITAPSVDISKLPPGTSVLDPTKVAQDPMLRYWAATALFEEVQLLNRYITDAAISDKYYPYLVRTQVTLMPRRRNLPYDAYTTLSFFNDDFSNYSPMKRFIEKERLEDLIDCAAWNVWKQKYLPSPPPGCDIPHEDKEKFSDWKSTDFQPEDVRLELDTLLSRESSVREALSRDAIRDGLVLASANQKLANHMDMLQAAIAYARERSPRFAGFRGFDPSQYVDAGDLVSRSRKNSQALDKAIDKYAEEELHPKSGNKSAVDWMWWRAREEPLPEGHQFDDVLSNSGDMMTGLVSIEDLELSLNDESAILRHTADYAEWHSRLMTEIIDRQGRNGSNFRPLVTDIRPKSPVVVPLLVTDDLQSAIESRSIEQIRQFALSVAAMAGKANVQGGLATLDEQLRSALGRSLDSTFTIARKSENEVLARFGASYQAGSRYAMVPDAHNVTLLVLVPKAYVDSVRQPMIHLQTRTTFVDAESGDELPVDESEKSEDFVANVLKRNHAKLASGSVSDLLVFAQDNDFDDFQAMLGGPSSPCERIWTEVMDWFHFRPTGDATIRLDKPQIPSVAEQFDRQGFAAIDDGKKSTIVTVRGQGDIFQQNIAAEIWVTPSKPTSAGTVEIHSTARGPVTLETAGANLSLTTTQNAKIKVQPTASGTTVSQNQNGTIKLAATQPAKITLTTTQPATITLHGDTTDGIDIQAPDGSTIVASTQPATDPIPAIVFYSTAVSVQQGKLIQFTFPSLAAMNVASKDSAPKLQMKVRFFHADKEEWHVPSYANLFDLKYVGTKPAALGLSIAVHTKFIEADALGTGEVLVTVSGYDPSKTTAKSFVTVDGADVVSASMLNSSQVFTGIQISSDSKNAGKIPVMANGLLKLSLKNLNPASNVTVSGEDENGLKSETPQVMIVDHANHPMRALTTQSAAGS